MPRGPGGEKPISGEVTEHIMPQERSEPIRLKFIRSTIDPRSVLVDEQLNPYGFDAIYDWAKRKIDFVVIDADTGEDITRILLAQN